MEREQILSRINKLTTMPVNDLRKLWLELNQKEAPSFNRTFLEARLAYRIQEIAFGGIAEETFKKIKNANKQEDGFSYKTPAYKPPTGTVFIKEFKGIQHRVKVLSDGFEYNGIKYTSLSAVAKKISGNNCSGLRFFGVNTDLKSKML